MNPALPLAEKVFGRGGIVAYHGIRTSSLLTSTHVTPGALDTHLAFLSAHYDVVPLHEFVARRMAGRSVRGCAAITFDDAYEGILTLGLPLLEKYRLPFTVFVASAYCRNNRRFWWDRLEWVMGRLAPRDRARLLGELGLRAEAADHAVRDVLITRFCGSLPRAVDRLLNRFEADTGLVPERAMTEQELARLAQSSLVEFGCHTVHHYALPWIGPRKTAREIRTNHHWLQKRLPRVRPFVAYPFGLYTAETIDAARAAGMTAAFSIEPRATTSRFPCSGAPGSAWPT